MNLLKDEVTWSEEIRRFLEERVRELYRGRALREVEKVLEQLPSVPKGVTIKLVREDRNSN